MQLHRVLATSVLLFGCERADSVEPSSSPIELPHESAPPIAQRPHTATVVLPTIEDIARRTAAKRQRAAMPRHLKWYFGLSDELQGAAREICRMRAADPCWMVPRSLPAGRAPRPNIDGLEPEVPSEVDGMRQQLAKFTIDTRDGVDDYCLATHGPDRCKTPLVVAFDAQPVAFSNATAATFAFVPGVPIATDWPTAATPWIALDRDGDGAITSGAELFGDSTVLPDNSTARNGFSALAALDANHDGIIDARDPAFAKLLLWTDRNGDHASSPDELRPLSEVVTAIPLANHLDVRCTTRHACEGERGIVQWRDASGVARTGAVVDVYLPHR